jgi:hypothetical protein
MFTHLDRSIFLTGILAPPILINGSDPLRTLSYSIQMNQEIELGPVYLQGGPGKSVADFKNKNIQGSISVNPRITQNSSLENSILDLISAAQNYTTGVSLTTLLLPYNPSVTGYSTVFTINPAQIYSLVFDSCFVKKLTIKVSEKEDAKIECDIVGQVDNSNNGPLPSYNNPINFEANNIYRHLSWFDCVFSRNGSQLENVFEAEVSIIKETDQPIFLMPVGTVNPYDSVFSTGVKNIIVAFKYIERITSVFDLFDYSFGGWLEGANFSGSFGPISFTIPNAIYKVSNQQLTSGVIERTTEGYYRMSPNTPDSVNFLFNIS